MRLILSTTSQNQTRFFQNVLDDTRVHRVPRATPPEKSPAPSFSGTFRRNPKSHSPKPLDPSLQSPTQPQTPAAGDDMIACVVALEAALLPCLPARELQAIDRSSHPSHQIDVERHARDFMEAAKKLQLYFLGLQHEDRPSKVEMLRKDIAVMQEELKVKKEIVRKQEQLIQGWRKDLKDQLDGHNVELGKV
ncbi:Mediator of RNA polymerase II transcription subunit 28-like protein [Drosera capensis]